MLGIFVLMAALGTLSGCGGSSSSIKTPTDAGTTAGTYTYTVTATSNPSVTPAVSTTFTIVVN